VILAKMAEPVEIPFGRGAESGWPKEPYQKGCRSPKGMGNFLAEKGRPIVKYWDMSTVSCAKTS